MATYTSFTYTDSAHLDALPITDGQLIILTDEDALYYDIESVRHPVGASDISELRSQVESMLISKEDKSNKVTEITDNPDAESYPTAQAVLDLFSGSSPSGRAIDEPDGFYTGGVSPLTLNIGKGNVLLIYSTDAKYIGAATPAGGVFFPIGSTSVTPQFYSIPSTSISFANGVLAISDAGLQYNQMNCTFNYKVMM